MCGAGCWSGSPSALALQFKLLIATVLAAFAVALLLVGPRAPLRGPGPWIAAALAGALAAPNLLWQAPTAGRKPYYTAGLLPALLAAGVPAMIEWVDGSAARRLLAVVLLVIHAAASAVIALPVVPASALHATPLPNINYDAGETVGWDRFVATVAGVAQTIPQPDRDRTIVLTQNYGEAGALNRARRAGTDLPPVYSGHNGYGLWGPPPETAEAVVLVGFGEADTARLFTTCATAAHIDNRVGLDNDEQGAPVRICTGPTRPWSQLWPQILRLG